MKLIFITNDPARAATAAAAGVDRIMVDLEIIGKHERQGHLDTVISRHTLADVERVQLVVPQGRLMVRVNPINQGSRAEIDEVIRLGADVIMLPMFKTVGEVEMFTELVGGRCRTSLLLETAEALARAHQIVELAGVDEVHVGLNDLHLSLGLDFMFEILAGGLLDHLARLCDQLEVDFGFGGIARVGRGQVPAAGIIGEHARLGSTAVILSRDFGKIFDDLPPDSAHVEFLRAVADVRKAIESARSASSGELEANRLEVVNAIATVAAARRSAAQQS